MARKKKTTKEASPLQDMKKDVTKKENITALIGFFILLFGIYIVISLVSYCITGASDQSHLEFPENGDMTSADSPFSNAGGAVGAHIAYFLMDTCFGVSSIFIAIFIIAVGLRMMHAYRIRLWKWFISCVFLTIWCSVALGFASSSLNLETHIKPGGNHGQDITRRIVSLIGQPGLLFVLLLTLLSYLTFLGNEVIILVRKALNPTRTISTWANAKRAEREALKKEKEQDEKLEMMEKAAEEEQQRIKADAETAALAQGMEKTEDDNAAITTNNNALDALNNEADDDLTNMEHDASETFNESDDVFIPEAEDEASIAETTQDDEPIAETSAVQTSPLAQGTTHTNGDVDLTINVADDPEKANRIVMAPYDPKLDLQNYHYPTLDLLKKYESNEPSVDNEEQSENKQRIITVLRNFGVEITNIIATVGPTITLYEITPAQGVRIAKIRNLEEDIALSLSAIGIRIIAPIPGKGTIGIEVPNKKANIVSMESILNSKKFQDCTYELPIALGKTITNEVYIADLAKMPHLLVAGATGQGKSVGLNAIITSLLYKKHPAELKFVMVDPKKVEFSIYAPIENHFLAKIPDDDSEPIITDTSKVVQTLKSLCVEMDTRYDLLKKAKVRNVKEYNERFKSRMLNPQNGHRFMPYIVVVIDEFGDLIMTAGKEVELPIARIAQLARAVGIHMIIATQRPTTNIITGTIKANFPARMAFKVSSMTDSRTILDRSGANRLIGRGDMLFLAGSEPVRVQCAFVDTPEVEQITSYVSRQQGYTHPFELPEVPLEGGDDSSSSADVDLHHLDSLFEEAARLIVIHQQGSTSLIQRKFSIGYNRAGRIMDQLEKAGIVGPTQGSKARDVLCADEQDLEMRLSSIR